MRHYKLDGRKIIECDLMEWARWLEDDPNKRIVAKTVIEPYEVSTVFLGLDHRFYGDEDQPPVLFETLVFPTDLEPLGGRMERCCTYDEAEAQHKRMCAAILIGTGELTELGT